MTSVDKRVVQMEFDDSQFDEGAKRAIETLERLDKSLVLKNGAKGLENIQKTAKGFNLNSVGDAITNARSKLLEFSAHAGSLISSVANKMMSFGKIAGGVLTGVATAIGTIAVHKGISRALNIEQAKFQMKGLGMDIEKTMADVSYAVDGTRFGLDEAAKAAGQLGASGVKVGDQMKQALRGISGVAAMTNAEYSEISPIFTTIAGQGKVMTIQLRQLEHRGLNVAATLAKAFNTTEANVREMVEDGKINFEMFSKAMDKAFGEQAKKANETFSGALANTKAALGRIGAEVAAPALENIRQVLIDVMPVLNAAKATFVGFGETVKREIGEVPKSTKEAIKKTGKYTNAFGQDIIKEGNKYYKVYKKFRLYGTIAKDMQKLRKTLKDFLQNILNSGKLEKFLGGAVKVFLGFKNIIKSIFTLLSPFGEMIGEIFKPFVKVKFVKKASSSFLEMSKALTKATKKSALLNDIIKPLTGFIGKNLGNAMTFVSKKIIWLFRALTDGLKNLRKFEKSIKKTYGPIIDDILKGIGNLKKAAGNIIDAIKIILKPISDIVANVANSIKTGIFDLFSNFNVFNHPALKTIGDFLKPITDFINNLIDKGPSKVFLEWSESVLAWSESVKEAATNSTFLSDFFASVESVASKVSPVFETLKNAIGGLISIAGSVLGTIGSKLSGVFQNLYPIVESLASKAFAGLQENVGKLVGFLQSINWEPVINAFSTIASNVTSFIEAIVSGQSPLEILKDLFSSIVSGVGGFAENAKNGLSGLPTMFSDLINNVKSGDLWDFGNALKFVADKGEALSSALDGIGTFIKENIVTPFSTLLSPVNAASTELKELNETIEGTSDALESDKTKAEENINGFAAFWEKFKNGLTLEDAKAFISLSSMAAIGVLSVGFARTMLKTGKALSEASEKVSEGIDAFKELPETIKGFKDAFKQEVKYNSILKMAVALVAVAGALKLMSTIDASSLILSAAILGGFMAGFYAFVKAFDKLDVKNVTAATDGMLKLAASMAIFAISMRILGSMSWEDIGKGVIAIGAYLVALSLLFTKTNLGRLASNVGTQVRNLSIGLLAIAATMFILGAMPTEIAEQGAKRLIVVFATLGIFFGILKKMKVQSVMLQLQGLGLALFALVGAMVVLSLMDFGKMVKAWLGLTLVLGSLVAFSGAMKKFSGGKMAEIGVGVIALAGAITILAVGLKILSTIPLPAMVISLLAVAAAMVIFTRAGRGLAFISAPFLQFSIALGIFAAATIGFGIGLAAIAGGLVILASIGSSVSEGIMALTPTLLELAKVGALLIPAAIAFALIAAGMAVLSAAALVAAIAVLAFAGAMKLMGSVNPSAIVDAMKAVADGFLAMLQVLADGSTQMQQNLVTIITAIVETLRQVIPQVALLAVDIVVKIFDGLVANAGRLINAGVTLIVQLLNGLAQGLPMILQAAINLALNFVQGLADGIRANKDRFGSVTVDLISALVEAFASAASQLLALGGDILGTVIEGILSAIGLGDLGKAAHETINGFVDGVGSVLGGLFNIGEDAADETAKGFSSKESDFGEAGGNFARAAGDEIEANADAPVTALGDMAEEGTNAFTENLDSSAASSAASDFMSNISSSVGEGKDEIVGQFQGISSEIGNSLGSDIDSGPLTASLGAVIGTSISKGKEKAKGAKSIGKQAASSAGKGASDNKDPAEKGGADIGQGLVNGIKTKTGPAGSAGYAIGAKALAEAKRAVKAKSPSREFHKLGVNIDEGLILGIKSMMDQVGYSGRDLGKTAVSATEKSIKAMSLALDDIDTAPTIRPVVDLSGIQAGVDAANSIFAGQSALQAQMAVTPSRFYDPNGTAAQTTSKQVNNTISITLDYKAGADATQITQDIAAGLMKLSFMEA